MSLGSSSVPTRILRLIHYFSVSLSWMLVSRKTLLVSCVYLYTGTKALNWTCIFRFDLVFGCVSLLHLLTTIGRMFPGDFSSRAWFVKRSTMIDKDNTPDDQAKDPKYKDCKHW